jgi:hypothetical protein
VVITVTAATLPLEQTYSLVVQGQFDGQLATPYNPGWDHAASTVQQPLLRSLHGCMADSVMAGWPVDMADACRWHTLSLLLVSNRVSGRAVQLCNQPTFNVTGPSGIINDNSASFSFVANGGAHCAESPPDCRRRPSTALGPAMQLYVEELVGHVARSRTCWCVV